MDPGRTPGLARVSKHGICQSAECLGAPEPLVGPSHQSPRNQEQDSGNNLPCVRGYYTTIVLYSKADKVMVLGRLFFCVNVKPWRPALGMFSLQRGRVSWRPTPCPASDNSCFWWAC